MKSEDLYEKQILVVKAYHKFSWVEEVVSFLHLLFIVIETRIPSKCRRAAKIILVFAGTCVFKHFLFGNDLFLAEAEGGELSNIDLNRSPPAESPEAPSVPPLNNWADPLIGEWRARTSAPIFPIPLWAQQNIDNHGGPTIVFTYNEWVPIGDPHAKPLTADNILILFKDGTACQATDFLSETNIALPFDGDRHLKWEGRVLRVPTIFWALAQARQDKINADWAAQGGHF